MVFANDIHAKYVTVTGKSVKTMTVFSDLKPLSYTSSIYYCNSDAFACPWDNLICIDF